MVLVDEIWGARVRRVPDSTGLRLYAGGDIWTVTPVSAAPLAH